MICFQEYVVTDRIPLYSISYTDCKNENGCTKMAGKEKSGIERVVNCICG